jgi:uncharacterized protein (DUF362 family)
MALEALREACGVSLRGRRVLIKPNVGFVAPAACGVTTHPEVVRGIIRFCRERGAAAVVVGESSVFGVDTDEAMASCGLPSIAREEGAELVNMDRQEAVAVSVPDPMAVERVRVSALALRSDLIVSVPVMKTHMHAGATLGIKNMKGCLPGEEKRRFHHLREQKRFARWHAYKTLDRAIADLYCVLPPHLAVIDGVVAMEGLGPLLGEPKPLGVVLASEDALVADLAALRVMGLAPERAPHIVLAAGRRGLARDALAHTVPDAEVLARLGSRFRLALAEDISAQFPHFRLAEGHSCSACHATAMAFLKTYGARTEPGEPVTIALGRGLRREDLSGRAILLGNCTARLRGAGAFLEGCPPVPSDILRALEPLLKGSD